MSSALRTPTQYLADRYPYSNELGPRHFEEKKPFEEYVKRGGPLQLLEAVYCDPCKAKVAALVNSLSLPKIPRLSVPC